MSLQTNLILTSFNFVLQIIFDMTAISGLSWWTLTLATLTVESWNFLWRAITDFLNTAYVTSVSSNALYSLEPNKMKWPETYITNASNSLVNRNNLQAFQHVTLYTDTHVRKSHTCIKLGNNICYKLATWLWGRSLKLHLTNLMWSEHTLTELSTETLRNCNYTEIEDVTTETLRKSKVQHRGQVCYCTANSSFTRLSMKEDIHQRVLLISCNVRF